MIHRLADVQSQNIGENTNIWQYCVILPNAVIGYNCNICASCFIENKVTVGNNVTIKNGVQIWDGIIIEDNVFIGPNVTFTNDILPRSKKHCHPLLPTIIEHNASIGANSTILCGITIGAYAMIGAGSVVTKNIKPNSLVYGNPAKIHGSVCKCGQKLNSQSYCTICKLSYTLSS